MASVSESVEVPLSPGDAWNNVSDLSRYDEWLTIHDGWRSDVPTRDDLAKGLKIASVVSIKGTRVRFEWVVDKFDPPNIVSLKGNGKGGVKVKLSLKAVASGQGSKVEIDLDLGGLPMIGPAGKAAAKLVSTDLKKSLSNFVELFGE